MAKVRMLRLWTVLAAAPLRLILPGLLVAFGARVQSKDFSSPVQDLVFRAWDTASGLPHNTVNALIQTRDGYLWIGTRDGLARFDGVRFTVFGLREGLPSVEVQTLYEDRHGTLWIGTSGGGLSRWTGSAIETISFPQRLAASGTVSSLAEDELGRLWIGTKAGLTIWEHGRFAQEGDLAKLSGWGIRALFADGTNGMWIATLSQGLYHYRDNHLTGIPGPAGNERVLAYCLLKDNHDDLWASIGNGIVLCRDQDRWRYYAETNGVPFAYVTCLSQGLSGKVWAGSLDDGLFCFDGDQFWAIRKEQGLSANDIRCLCPDREGHLWVGTRTGGLNRLGRAKLISYAAHQGLTNDYTRSVAETADGTLWVGTTGGGLWRGGAEGFQAFAPFHSVVETVLAARDGSLWWGAARGLFCWRDGKLAGSYTNEPWLGPAAVTALGEDGMGRIWVGTSDGRLLRYQDRAFNEIQGAIARGAITGLAQESDGRLWVGSMAGGLKLVGADCNILPLSIKGLQSDAIRTLYLDNSGTLWVGTAGGGLSRCRGGAAFTFTERHGLAAQTVVQIVEDDFGFLWLGTTRGVLRVPKSELNAVADGKASALHARAFGLNEGMPAEECSSGFCPAGLKTRAGLICISTVKGLVLFNPRDQQTNSPAPDAYFEEVLVNDQPQRPEFVSNSGTATVAGGAGKLWLAPGSRDLEVHYTGIDFSSPERLRFRYQLEGLDPTWVDAGERRVAWYHNLPPRKFVFRVLACNADGVWGKEAATLAVAVQPYLWETNWFKVGALLVITVIFGGLIRLVEVRRYRRSLARIETRHAVERERLRISQDMHDDIGSILTQVSQLSDLGQSDTEKPAAAKSHFKKIGIQARSAVQALDEIVWATNPKNDNLARFAEYVCQFADEMFENTLVRCWQEVPTGLPKLPLGTEVRHNVFLAIKEAFNNVLKHSRASEVWLRLSLEDSQVCVSVEDNGNGFDIANVKLGNGLENMKTRLKECGGRAELSSVPGKGTTVRFFFPLAPLGARFD